MASPLALLFSSFRTLLNETPGRLARIPDDVAARSLEENKWSAKQELGHLADSAINNHARLIRVQIETCPELPGYDQREWVRRNGYQSRSWAEIITLWQTLNQHLLLAAGRISLEDWQRTATFLSAWGKPPASVSPDVITLRFLFEDYIEHMRHHLKHIDRWLAI